MSVCPTVGGGGGGGGRNAQWLKRDFQFQLMMMFMILNWLSSIHFPTPPLPPLPSPPPPLPPPPTSPHYT